MSSWDPFRPKAPLKPAGRTHSLGSHFSRVVLCMHYSSEELNVRKQSVGFFFHVFFLGFQRKQLTLKKKKRKKKKKERKKERRKEKEKRKLPCFSLSHLSLAHIQAGHRWNAGLNQLGISYSSAVPTKPPREVF